MDQLSHTLNPLCASIVPHASIRRENVIGVIPYAIDLVSSLKYSVCPLAGKSSVNQHSECVCEPGNDANGDLVMVIEKSDAMV